LLESHGHVGNSGEENMAAAVMFQRFQWLELQNIWLKLKSLTSFRMSDLPINKFYVG